jgi:hypothetical protein
MTGFTRKRRGKRRGRTGRDNQISKTSTMKKYLPRKGNDDDEEKKES